MNVRDRSNNNAKKEDRKIGRSEVCQILDMMPHKAPSPGDRNYNVVTGLVKRRMQPFSPNGTEKIIHARLVCMQRFHGKFQGETWEPRIGDLVYVTWIYENTGLVIGIVPTNEQEPVCRPAATRENPDYIFKRCKFKMPGKIGNMEDYVVFPNPEHPDCFHWFHKTRDSVYVWDCPHGHADPSCKLCDKPDFIKSGTYWKYLSDEYDGEDDKPRRVKFHHHCGSLVILDDDGVIHIENRVAEDPRAHITLYPDASVVIRSSDDDVGNQHGAHIYLAGDHGSESGKIIVENDETQAQAVFDTDGSIELKHSSTSIKISSTGAIILTSPTEINLNTPAVYVNGVQLEVP